MKVILISADESRAATGVRTLSSCLRGHGFDTLVALMASYDSDYGEFRWNTLYDLCRDADIIGISFMTHALGKAVDIKNRLEEITDAPIVAGGIHATLDPESLLGPFSYVCHGEGEDIIVEMARRIDREGSLIGIPGLWTNLDGEVAKPKAVPLVRGLDEYPIPDYDMSHQYVIDGDTLVPIRPIPFHMDLEEFVVLGSRGCPHGCTYCCNRKIKEDFPWRKRVGHYSVDYLINHLKAVKKQFPEVRSLWIEDDTFFAKKQDEIDEFATRYKNEVGIPFKILISPWTYSQEKLAPLVDAGMTKLIMGIQSGCERVNKDVYERRITNDRLLQVAMSLDGFSNLLKCYDFIGMNPFETAEDLLETIRFLKSLPLPFFIFANNLAFYPGTALHARAVDVGLDISLREKHFGDDVGHRILIHEKLQHKLFHLLLLLTGGMVTRWRFGKIPRLLFSEPLLHLYAGLDRSFPKLSNAIAIVIARVLMTCQWRKWVKAIFPAHVISAVRHKLVQLRKPRVEPK